MPENFKRRAGQDRPLARTPSLRGRSSGSIGPEYQLKKGAEACAATPFLIGGRRHNLIEPLLVVRKCLNSWGKRTIDLRQLHKLRFEHKLSLPKIAAILNLSKSTLIDNLKKANALYGTLFEK
jgi:hypothetical protein